MRVSDVATAYDLAPALLWVYDDTAAPDPDPVTGLLWFDSDSTSCCGLKVTLQPLIQLLLWPSDGTTDSGPQPLWIRVDTKVVNSVPVLLIWVEDNTSNSDLDPVPTLPSQSQPLHSLAEGFGLKYQKHTIRKGKGCTGVWHKAK